MKQYKLVLFVICLLFSSILMAEEIRQPSDDHPILGAWILVDVRVDVETDSEDVNRMLTSHMDAMMQQQMKVMLESRMTFDINGVLNVRMKNGMDNDLKFALDSSNIALTPSYKSDDILGKYTIEDGILHLTLDFRETALANEKLAKLDITFLKIDGIFILERIEDPDQD